MMRIFTKLFFILVLAMSFLLPSCNQFEGEQTIPSYIRIDSIGLSCDYYTYGANTHNITDAWVYVDDDIVGCFELPCTFPVLKSGKHKVEVRAGIKVNGIAAARSPYQFFQAKVYDEVDLFPDSIVKLNPVVTYLPNGDNLHVRWMEDFDQGSIGLTKTSYSDTTIIRVGGAEAWHDPDMLYSTYSGKIVLTSDTMCFSIASTEELDDLPQKGSACMLEMDFNTSDTCLVGMYCLKNNTIQEIPLVQLPPTSAPGTHPNHWKKIYINLGPNLVYYEGATYFKPYLASWDLRNPGEQYFYFDNLKIIYRDR